MQKKLGHDFVRRLTWFAGSPYKPSPLRRSLGAVPDISVDGGRGCPSMTA
jgi:hypothetical protein